MGGELELVWCALRLILVALVSSGVGCGAESAESAGVVLSVELIHRDSPMSPMYSPSQTHWQRLTNALQRSNHHHHYSSQAKAEAEAKAEAGVLYSKGEYVMNISIGTPPVGVIGIIDTGSDLIWTQCKPCLNCFSQKDPLFDPSSSSTNTVLSCHSQPCKLIGDDTACSSPPGNFCNYTYTYGDASFTSGNLSTDTLTLQAQYSTSGSGTPGRPISFPNIVFGCGHHNGGVFGGIESGIVGLGRGPLSLVSQMPSSSSSSPVVVNGKNFSHCLVNPLSSRSNTSGKMVFGENPMLSGPDVLSTPLLTNASETYYYLRVEAVSVGDHKFQFHYNNTSSSSSSFKGNILIDSGTTYTFMPPELYKEMDSAIRKAVKLEVVDDPTKISRLCYRTKSDISVDAATVTFHFEGADVKLKPSNTFLRVRHDILCFAFIPNDDIPIYGNIAQMDFLIGYDLNRELLYFKPTDCTTTN